MESFQLLEERFGKFAGYTKEQTVACSSGTAALHLALEALKLPQGSEVILCDFNMVACARAVTLAGLKPVFVDCIKDTLLIDPERVAEYVDRRMDYAKQRYHNIPISAILCTHIYGRPCEMSYIHDIAGKYDLKVIEDLAEAHGLNPHPNTDAACWSFYRNKIVHGEEGGAVVFRDEEKAKTAKCLRSLGFGADQDYKHTPRGHNYRLANCLADKVIENLNRYKSNVQYRREMETAYDLFCPEEWKQPARFAPWVYDIRIPGMLSTQQDSIVKALKANGIEARHAFQPMSSQEEYRNSSNDLNLRHGWRSKTQAEVAANEVIYLPLTPSPSWYYYKDYDMENDARKAFDIIKSTLATYSVV